MQLRAQANGFLEKNRDTLTDDLLEMLQKSKQGLINVLFPKDAVMSTKDKKSSLSKQFQKQLHDLMYTLNSTEPHYIRCVKPNEFKSARCALLASSLICSCACLNTAHSWRGYVWSSCAIRVCSRPSLSASKDILSGELCSAALICA